MRYLTLASLSMCLMACQPADEEYRAAVPRITIAVPEQPRSKDPNQPPPAEFYVATRDVASSVNAATKFVFGIVDSVSSLPPTTRTDDSRVWGPVTPGIPGVYDPITYRLVVRHVTGGGAETFSFSLDGRPGASRDETAWLPILDGTTTKGATPATGRGALTVHFDHLHQLLGLFCLDGSLAFDVDTSPERTSVDLMLERFIIRDPAASLFTGCGGGDAIDGVFHFDRQADGAGSFRFGLVRDVDGDTSSRELARVQSRWAASGAGRADVEVTSPALVAKLFDLGLGTHTVSITECWDAQLHEVYQTSTPISIRPTTGDEGSCLFDASLQSNTAGPYVTVSAR